VAETLRQRMEAGLRQREDAIKRWITDPALAPELLVVRCRVCGTPITTSAQDRKRGEPHYVLDLIETHDPSSWECWTCHRESQRKNGVNGLGGSRG
jgi:hypothetical protein